MQHKVTSVNHKHQFKLHNDGRAENNYCGIKLSMSGQIYTEDQCAIQCHFKAKLGEKRNLRMKK